MLSDYMCYCGKEFKTFKDWWLHDQEEGCVDHYSIALIKVENNEPLNEEDKRILRNAPQVNFHRAWQVEKAGGWLELAIKEKNMIRKIEKEMLAEFRMGQVKAWEERLLKKYSEKNRNEPEIKKAD